LLAPLNSDLVETGIPVSDLRLDGGHLALDFVNSVGGPAGLEPDPRYEALHRYGDLLDWSIFASALDETAVTRLRRRAGRDPAAAAEVFEDALERRARNYRVFLSLAHGESPAQADLDALRDDAGAALEHARLAGDDDGGYRWSWPEADALEAPLWPVAHASVELLTDAPLERLRRCANCRWLFLDQSKNRSRRWCSMNDCGTAVKKRRYVERRRERRALS
jgi:predicted RNA-binding Zn ribbon-like protein